MADNNSTKSTDRKTAYQIAAAAWNRLTSRAGAKYNHSQCYKNVEVRMTRDEFMSWAVPEYEKWLSEHPDLTPSVDRIDSVGHYEIGNLRLIEVQKNRRRAKHFVNDNAPEGMRWCKQCGKFLPLDLENFHPSDKNGGFTSQCKKHASEAARERHLKAHPPGDEEFKAKQKTYNRIYKLTKQAFNSIYPPEDRVITWKEFRKWALPAYEAYLNSNPANSLPQVERIDRMMPFCLGNLQLVSA